ncbi:hypothetical protein HAX54_020450, partial [Datura stramonium]|nr:hypothetical protein [Datura stramonium]
GSYKCNTDGAVKSKMTLDRRGLHTIFITDHLRFNRDEVYSLRPCELQWSSLKMRMRNNNYGL